MTCEEFALYQAMSDYDPWGDGRSDLHTVLIGGALGVKDACNMHVAAILKEARAGDTKDHTSQHSFALGALADQLEKHKQPKAPKKKHGNRSKKHHRGAEGTA